MKKLFENWRKHLNEAAVPHSANHVVKKMMKTGKGAKETLKSLTTDLSDEEAERWLERHKDEMESAKQDLDEAAYEPGRAVTNIDTGEDYMSPDEVALANTSDRAQDMSDKFMVSASVEIASDGKPAIVVRHEDGEISTYHDIEEMYVDLADRMEMSAQNNLPSDLEKFAGELGVAPDQLYKEADDVDFSKVKTSDVRKGAVQQGKAAAAGGITDQERGVIQQLQQQLAGAAQKGNIATGKIMRLATLLSQELQKNV